MADSTVTHQLLAFLGANGRGSLATLKSDGRPQLSLVDYAFDLASRTVRVSTTDGRAKVHNLRRDPRVSLLVSGPGGAGYVVAEGVARLTPTSADAHDATVEELVDVYRAVRGEHPDWDEYRAAMVTDRRLVVGFRVEHAYGWIPG